MKGVVLGSRRVLEPPAVCGGITGEHVHTAVASHFVEMAAAYERRTLGAMFREKALRFSLGHDATASRDGKRSSI